MEILGGIIIMVFVAAFAIGSAEMVAQQKGQSLFGDKSSPFDKSNVKYKDGDNT